MGLSAPYDNARVRPGRTLQIFNVGDRALGKRAIGIGLAALLVSAGPADGYLVGAMFLELDAPSRQLIERFMTR